LLGIRGTNGILTIKSGGEYECGTQETVGNTNNHYLEKTNYAPSQINERQSSHDTCTREAAGGHTADGGARTELEAKEHGPPPPPPGFTLDLLPLAEDLGGGGALQ